MPIKPENKKLYPKNWKEISLDIRNKANNRCQFCQAENGSLISRFNSSWQNIITGERRDEGGNILHSYKLSEIPFDSKEVTIVLTVAHLDHNPSNCDYSNLRALCQKCHLNYDLKNHLMNSAKTRDLKKYGSLSLFSKAS